MSGVVDPRNAPERSVVVSGLGQSDVGRPLQRSGLDLTLDACLEAIADAGLTRNDIDGISAYPGPMAAPPGFAGPGTTDVQNALGLRCDYHRSGQEGAAQFSAIIDAVMAVATGMARHVLVYRTVTEASAQKGGGRSGIGLDGADLSSGGAGQGPKRIRMGGEFAWQLPMGAFSAANWTAWYAQRHMHEYGLTREQLGAIALNGRANAARNPKAVYTAPMTMDDYLSARMISEPLCLFDCDAPCDGSTAFVISHVDHAPDMPRPAVRFEAMGGSRHRHSHWDQGGDFTTMAGSEAAAAMWRRTTLTPADVDTAQLYDGFSWLTIMWLEALGFCRRGEAGGFVEGGKRIALDGELPLNTWGGQLSGGRLHGFGFLHEAVTQLRGEGGARQIQRRPEVAVAAAGGGPIAGCFVLTRV